MEGPREGLIDPATAALEDLVAPTATGGLEAAASNLRQAAAAARSSGDQIRLALVSAELALNHARAGGRSDADAAISEAMAAANATGSLLVRGLVAWRYLSMLVTLDRAGDAWRMAEEMLAGLRDDDPLELRLTAHSVAASIATALGNWAAVRSHSEQLLRHGAHVEPVVAQARMGLAHAAFRIGHVDQAKDEALAALSDARRLGLNGLIASALLLLTELEAVPEGIDVEPELERLADLARAGGDLGGDAAARAALGRLRAKRGAVELARKALDEAIAAALQGQHVFVWGKALIWRAPLAANDSATVGDLTTGWAALSDVIEAIDDPLERQHCVVSWRGMADSVLAEIPRDVDGRLDNPHAAALAVAVFEGMALDVLDEAQRDLATDVETPSGAGAPPDSDHDLPRRYTDLLQRLRGRCAVAYRVLRAQAEWVMGWRLTIAPDGTAYLDEFELRDDPAFEIKLLAERNPAAPTPYAHTWKRLADALLPPGVLLDGEGLLIAPHGPLWLVPWGALQVGDEPAIAHGTVELVTSLRTGATTPQQTTEMRTAIAAVDPRLPGAQADAQALTDLFGPHATVATSKDDLTEALSRDRPDVLVISAHGSGIGSEWALQLSDTVGAPELASMPLPPTVIAASCFSGRQAFEPWPPGLVAGCLAGGATSVIAGTWDIPDRTTSQAVATILALLRDGAATPAGALRTAQLELFERGEPVRSWAGLSAFRH